MPTIKMTELTIQSLKPGNYYDEKTPAFAIRVGKHRKTWFVVRNRTRHKVTIGHYPSLTLAEARKRAMLALASPAEPKPQMSFDDARRAFLQLNRWRPQSLKVLTSGLKHFQWKRPLSKITHEDVATALEAIPGPSAKTPMRQSRGLE